MLSGVQEQFRFSLPPERLSKWWRPYFQREYRADEVFKILLDYLAFARGGRRFVIGIIDQQLNSNTLGNLFGSHRAEHGVAVVTLRNWESYTESVRQFLSYYFIRYALSFVDSNLKSHAETRDCFFDRKINKADLQKSLESGRICPEHKEQFKDQFTPEVNEAFQKMVGAMKSLRTDSPDELMASSLRGQIDIGILTMKTEEFRAVLDRFRRRRRVLGTGSNYNYARVTTARNEELRIAIGRTAMQGQGPAQALASSMLRDLNPRWLFVVGIAGAFPTTEFSLGDVLLSQRMHDFSVSAAIEGRPWEYEDLGGPMALEVEKLVKDLPDWIDSLGDWSGKESLGRDRPEATVPELTDTDNLYGSEEWSKKVIKSLQTISPALTSRKPIALPATILTSNTFVKDTELAKAWLSNARFSAASEMELGGVALAARSVGDDRTRVLAIRGISDIVGFRRSPEWTEFACQTAAAFAHSLIVSGILRPNRQIVA
jgi:nucleoside phosphorylase